jgi:hypothetical protein
MQMEEHSSDSSYGVGYVSPATQSPPPESCFQRGEVKSFSIGVPDPISSSVWETVPPHQQHQTITKDNSETHENKNRSVQSKNVMTDGSLRHCIVPNSSQSGSLDPSQSTITNSVRGNLSSVDSVPVSKSDIHAVSGTDKVRSFSFSQLKASTDEIDNLSCCEGEDRKMKRLERNRESARLSRRRRKQYLEVLEERVTSLCHEMDRGRREHALSALNSYKQSRQALLKQIESELDSDDGSVAEKLYHNVNLLTSKLSYSSSELMLASTFGREYLKSLIISPSKKFILWLTLQNDVYFRGGRAASERLSAARIGEKILSSGKRTAAPNHSMWPLFCNEVGLSYDQEERIRSLQREILGQSESWLHRHAIAASEHVLLSSSKSVEGLAHVTKIRQKKLFDVLSPSQKIKYFAWLAKRQEQKKHMVDVVYHAKTEDTLSDLPSHEPSSDKHVAANLYIINHKLSAISNKFKADVFPQLSKSELRRLSRRPAFESLANIDEPAATKKRKSSGDFNNGMKRSSSEVSCLTLDHSDGHQSNMKKSTSGHSLNSSAVTPENAQSASSSYVLEALGNIRFMIPHEYLIQNSQPASIPSQLQVQANGKPSSVQYQAVNIPQTHPASSQNYTSTMVPEYVSSSAYNQHTPTVQMSSFDPVPIETYSSYRLNPPNRQQQTDTTAHTKLKASASAPVFGALQIPEEEELTNDALSSFLPFGDTDDAIFDLDGDLDWAIGEGNVLDF